MVCSAQVKVSADGPGNTYELLESRASASRPRIAAIQFGMYAKSSTTRLARTCCLRQPSRPGRRPCTNFDRQRIEVKTAPEAPTRTFCSTRTDRRPSIVGSSDCRPVFRPPRTSHTSFRSRHRLGVMRALPCHDHSPAGSPDRLEIIWTPPTGQSGSGVKAQADLSLFRNVWVEAFVQYRTADAGMFSSPSRG